ncbi:MAG: hypothetical protein K6A63_02170 [Acholeplasmatales bacterium]|nr:hypothetical protein [Acholeplasmatales bacterium]
MVVLFRGIDEHIDAHCDRLGLTHPVYFVNNHIASLESHKIAFPNSTALSIEEAEQERIAYDAEQEEVRRQLALLQQEDTENE